MSNPYDQFSVEVPANDHSERMLIAARLLPRALLGKDAENWIERQITVTALVYGVVEIRLELWKAEPEFQGTMIYREPKSITALLFDSNALIPSQDRPVQRVPHAWNLMGVRIISSACALKVVDLADCQDYARLAGFKFLTGFPATEICTYTTGPSGVGGKPLVSVALSGDRKLEGSTILHRHPVRTLDDWLKGQEDAKVILQLEAARFRAQEAHYRMEDLIRRALEFGFRYV